MPELPEVETVARDLIRAGLIGRTITGVTVLWPRTIQHPSLDSFEAQVRGQSFVKVGRRGKYLLLDLHGSETLVVHLRMTGRLDIVPAETLPSDHLRVAFDLDDGTQLRFRDQRKFGRIALVPDAADVVGVLGPEPIDSDFSVATLCDLLGTRRRQLKPLLLDQRFLAGLGNIYVDEALWLARLHPQRTCDTLTQVEIEALWEAMRLVLERGIENAGTSFSTYFSVGGKRGQNQEELAVFRRTGEPCPRCGTTIQRLIVGQRSTHICPTCQPLTPP